MNTPKFVFMFIVAATVVAGLLILGISMLAESPVSTTIPSAPTENVNMTSGMISTVGTLSVDLALPALILIAALVAISAIYLFTKRR